MARNGRNSLIWASRSCVTPIRAGPFTDGARRFRTIDLIGKWLWLAGGLTRRGIRFTHWQTFPSIFTDREIRLGL